MRKSKHVSSADQLCLIDVVPSLPGKKQSRKPRSTDSTAVADGVGMRFATRDMFPQIGFLPQSRTAKEIMISALRVASGKIHPAPEFPDDDRSLSPDESLDDAPEMGPNCVFSDEQLAAEQRDWVANERQAHLMHIGCLEENLAFLLATDTKPRVWDEKGEILQWIWTEDEIDDVSTEDIAFSFVNCCRLSGLDPVELRRMLLQVPVVRSLLVNLYLAKEEDLPPLRNTRHYADYVGPERATPAHPVYQFAGVT